MGLLKEAVKQLRKPLLEGRGIKVFRIVENTEDWWQDQDKDVAWQREMGSEAETIDELMDDQGVQTLAMDINKALNSGTSFEFVEKHMDDFMLDAEVELTPGEQEVLLAAFKDGSIDRYLGRSEGM